MNKKRDTRLTPVPHTGTAPINRAWLSATLTSLVLSSASVVAQTTSESPNALNKPAYTLKIVTHGENSNRSDNFSEAARKDNRRADVSIKTQIPNGYREINTHTVETKRVQTRKASNRSVRLPDGGVVWVTKDPAKIVPKLNVTGNSSVEIENNAFVTPISFTISTNYAQFIDTWELAVYRAEDEQHRKPLVTFMGKDLSVDRVIKWNGVSKTDTLQSGDKLVYILSAKSKAGHLDETYARTLNLVGPDRNLGFAKNTQTGSNALENNLKRQTIPVHGSTVRVYGRDIVEGNKISINNKKMTVSDQRFITETILPEGDHSFNVAVTDNAQKVHTKQLDVTLKGKYLFMVGIADITAGEGKVTGNLESLSDGDKHLDGDIFVDGRLAFYLKGKIKGKYLVTAQMDTETAPIDELFDDLHKKDPQSIFRRLDPDQYYPVYGDDSTLIDDTDSQGKLYVRVDWDKSRALWGNYNTDFTGTELSAFNRSLYGAKLNHKNTRVTKDGEHKTDLTLFASEAQSAYRHNQFLGTGGSLYYLKDKDIVDGSEKVWIEVRERGDSERALEKIILEEGRDYQIDDFQGRIILHRPLLQIARQANPSLIKDEPLDGNQVYLMVDYEYVPDDFDSDRASYGARGKVWVNDHVTIGGTYVHENRDNQDYDLKGIDVTLQKAKGTYIKGEYAKSESNQTLGSFLSSDGGLNFTPFNNTANALANIANNEKGNAYSIEARANLNDISNKEGTLGAWYKQRDKGFSNARYDNLADTTDAGIEALVEINDKLDASLRATLLDKKTISKETAISLQGDYKANEKTILSAELRHVKEDDQVNSNNDGEGTLAAFKVGYDLNKDINLYVIGQGTLNKQGNYDNNDRLTLGTIAKINDRLDLNAEVSTGNRGDDALIGLKYLVNDGYDVYTNYTHSTDRTDNKRNLFTVGQRKTLTDQLKVYTEHQFTHEDTQSGLGHTFGLDYELTKELNLNASVQAARLDQNSGGSIDRDAFSVGLNYKKDRTEASTRLEYRKDKGNSAANNEHTEQWVTTNRVNHRLSPSLRIQGKFNFSKTEDQLSNQLDARFVEAGFGFALRPVHHDRHNILGRLTYLYDLKPLGQDAGPDERSLIASIENSYQVNQRWEIGGKLAHRKSEIRTDRNTGSWTENDATLAAARVRYHLTHNWDAMAEYHWLHSDASKDTQHGAMISVDRHIGKNLKIGIGYNFTQFDDDLSNDDGDAKGWFVNLVGKF